MLKSISLENYKCFKDETEIEIAPLTVLCGVNSSGKSSILKSLLMLKQSYENESPYNEMTFNGKWVDNGYFDDIVYHKEDITKENIDKYNSFVIKNTFDILDTSDINGNTNDIRRDAPSFKELKKIYFFIKEINCFRITVEIEVSRVKKNESDLIYFVENNQITNYCISIDGIDLNTNTHKVNSTISLKKVLNTERAYLLSYSQIPNINRNNGRYFLDSCNEYRCSCYFSNMHLTNIYKSMMPQKIRLIKSTLLSIFNIIASQYNEIDFIAPLRHNPARNYIIKGNVDSVGISGEDAPILLAKLYGKVAPKTFDIFPPNSNLWLKIQSEKVLYEEIIQEWFNYFELGKLNLNGENGLLSINISNHNIVDVGFGVSQILPIIIQGINMRKDQTLLLEQPEIHLHPKMQMSLADFLIQLSKTNRNIIVETHSDHIINRLVKRIMENKDTDRDLSDIIKIYFVNSKNELNKISVDRIKISKYSGIINAKEDFFTQFASETESILNISYKNLEKDNFQYLENEEDL